jgi:hypothetical protein
VKLTDLDNAIDTALTALKAAGTVNSAEVLSDQETDVEELFRRLGARAPFVLAVYTGGAFAPLNVAAGVYRHAPEYAILVGVTRVRPSDDTARDALHPVVADVINALSGKQLSLDISPIKFTGRIDLVSWVGKVMVFGLTIQTEFAWDVSGEAA